MLASKERLHLYATSTRPLTFGRANATTKSMNNVPTQLHAEDTASGLSDLSALENETDDFGRKLLQHQRNVQRLNASRLPFLKDRQRQAVPESFARDGVDTASVHERTGSAGSNESDPPLNIPRDWGRRGAKRKLEWQRRQTAARENTVVQGNNQLQQEKDGDAILPRRTTYTGDEDPIVDWRSGAEEALPFIETTPPSLRRRRPDSTPSSMNHMNTTIQDPIESEDQDFTAASLLASTPTANNNRRNRRIDELTRREIETIERRGITKRTLEQISTTTEPELRPATAPTQQSSSRIPRRQGYSIANKENVQPDGGLHTGVKETVELSSRTAQAMTSKNTQRPFSHARGDSYNLLRQLARVSSMSPSPAKDRVEPDAGGTPSKTGPSDFGTGRREPPREKRATDEDTQTVQRRTGQLSQVDVRSNGPKDRETGAAPGPNAPHIDVTPLPKFHVQDAKTPVVTGAWPNTPVLQTDNRRSNPTKSTQDQEPENAKAEVEPGLPGDGLRRIKSEPVHRKSALTDILAEARRESEVQFGDSTIASLEDIVNPNGDITETTLTLDLGNSTQEIADNIDAGHPLTTAEKDRRQEVLAMEAMNKSLRHARTSIKDASRGLRRVENRMETAQSNASDQRATAIAAQEPATASAANPTAKTSLSSPSFLGRTECVHCGGLYKSIWRALWTEFTDCFYIRSASSIRLTRLGLFCTLFLVWYLTEQTLCAVYCHPLSATSMIGTGVDINAPEFPFVIPTLLFRPFKFLWEPVVRYIFWLAGVVFNAVFGEIRFDAPASPTMFKGKTPLRFHAGRGGAFRIREEVGGLMGNQAESLSKTATGRWVAATAAAGGRVVYSLRDAVDEVGKFWDDEFVS